MKERKRTDASQIKVNIVKIKQGDYENVTLIVILINNNNNHKKKVTLIFMKNIKMMITWH